MARFMIVSKIQYIEKMSIAVNFSQLQQYINQTWEDKILPTLIDYIRIPNKSPLFDAHWEANGHMDKAVKLLADWCHAHAPRGMQLEVIREPGHTPLIFIEVPGNSERTVLLYGHCDKQPEMTGWNEGLGPWQPVLRGDKLYGRGGADDGYSTFAALTAINAIQAQGLSHPRCVILIEATEESGSQDLLFYLEQLLPRIGTPELIVCLDSGCVNYEQLWMTTSLRGMVKATLRVDILQEGVHSGTAGGIVPSSFQIARQLLDRIEDANTGKLLLPELFVEIPQQRVEQVRQTADLLGQTILDNFSFVKGAQAITMDPYELLLNSTWRPALEIVGADGLPSIGNASNVLRPYTSLRLSFRLPPSCDSDQAGAAIKKALEANPPYHAKITCDITDKADGWNAPLAPEALLKTFHTASEHAYGKPLMATGEGGTIPFMGMLGKKFPQAQFLVTGVLGPGSNAHGPNEFLHIPMAKKLTACVAEVIATYAVAFSQSESPNLHDS